jgi:hypothetical protein
VTPTAGAEVNGEVGVTKVGVAGLVVLEGPVVEGVLIAFSAVGVVGTEDLREGVVMVGLLAALVSEITEATGDSVGLVVVSGSDVALGGGGLVGASVAG